jgi:hypothetical protein
MAGRRLRKIQIRLDGRLSLAADRRRSRCALTRLNDEGAALVKPDEGHSTIIVSAQVNLTGCGAF